MKNTLNLIALVVILLLIASCSTLKTYPDQSYPSKISDVEVPEIGFDKERAFFPFRQHESGQILPSYQSKVCVKSILGICTKWQIQRQYFKMEWFLLNDFGACKRPRP